MHFEICLDGDGRVILTDADIEDVSRYDIMLSGGANMVCDNSTNSTACVNASCAFTINTACANSTICAGSTNFRTCTGSGGGGGGHEV